MFAGLGLMPLATGVAILRYRLYDLDRLVSRTIAYAVVTAGLVLVYLAIDLASPRRSAPIASGNPAVVAASTLVVAVLFQPLRRRVQRAVDRRFDRARYDSARTSGAFSERVRDEVDLPSLADRSRRRRAAVRPVGSPSGSARDGRDDPAAGLVTLRERRSPNIGAMAVSQARWVALLWILGMGSLGLSLWASAMLVPGTVTWQEAVWALLFGSAFLAVGAILVVRRPPRRSGGSVS